MMGLTFNWKSKEASTPTNVNPCLKSKVRPSPFPSDHQAHRRAQPSRTRGQPCAQSRAATRVAPLRTGGRRATDHLLLLFLLLLPPPGALLQALRRPPARHRPNRVVPQGVITALKPKGIWKESKGYAYFFCFYCFVGDTKFKNRKQKM